MEQLVHMALLTKSNSGTSIKSKKKELTEKSAYVSVPVALYIFMALMHENPDILDVDGNIDDNQQY